MRFGIPEDVLDKIVVELKKRKNIKRALLFGSRAKEDYKYNSDIDIAILTEGEIEPGLMSDLDEAAGIYKIDIIDFNKLSCQALKEKILKEGVVIYERGD